MTSIGQKVLFLSKESEVVLNRLEVYSQKKKKKREREKKKVWSNCEWDWSSSKWTWSRTKLEVHLIQNYNEFEIEIGILGICSGLANLLIITMD